MQRDACKGAIAKRAKLVPENAFGQSHGGDHESGSERPYRETQVQSQKKTVPGGFSVLKINVDSNCDIDFKAYNHDKRKYIHACTSPGLSIVSLLPIKTAFHHVLMNNNAPDKIVNPISLLLFQ